MTEAARKTDQLATKADLVATTADLRAAFASLGGPVAEEVEAVRPKEKDELAPKVAMEMGNKSS